MARAGFVGSLVLRVLPGARGFAIPRNRSEGHRGDSAAAIIPPSGGSDSGRSHRSGQALCAVSQFTWFIKGRKGKAADLNGRRPAVRGAYVTVMWRRRPTVSTGWRVAS
nr:hypothetical protein GCM10025732_09100 [Glycomyces mayteni]